MELMDLYEFCKEFGISVKKAKKMHKRGVLRLRGDVDDHTEEMKFYLSKGQHLPIKFLLLLSERPAMVWSLGRYTVKAERQLTELGDVKGEAAPREVGAQMLAVR